MSAANVTKVANVINEVDIEQLQTLWVGGLNEKVTEEILYELFQNVSYFHTFGTALSSPLNYVFTPIHLLIRQKPAMWSNIICNLGHQFKT
jgi:hypothetical protein